MEEQKNRFHTYDSQYVQMNVGAHRKPASHIGAPSLIWQRSFWRPTQEKEKHTAAKTLLDAADKIEKEDQWSYDVDELLLRIFEAVCPDRTKKFICPNLWRAPDDDPVGDTLYLLRNKVQLCGDNKAKPETLNDTERAVRHAVFQIHQPIAGGNLIVGAALHEEYFTLMLAVDFVPDGENAKTQPELIRIKKQFDKLHTLIETRYKPLTNRPDSSRSYELDEPTNALINESRKVFADEFKSWITGVCGLSKSLNTGNELISCGTVFHDSLGIVFGLRIPERDPRMGLLTRTQPVLLQPGHSARTSALVKGTDFFTANALGVVDAIWPVVRGIHDDRKFEEYYGKPEYSISLFQDRTVIYLSSLGRIPPDNLEKRPIVYTLVVSYVSKWRLGRLVSQLHSMGALRLAALRDLAEISRAEDEINSISRRARTSGSVKVKAKLASELLVEFGNIGAKIDLPHRILRSRYYVAAFRNLVEMLRTTKVEGFLPYDEFMRRRLFDTFSYIDRLGYRYDDLKQSLLFQIEWGQQHDRTTQAEQTSYLLKAAEIVSIFPITYYLGHIFIAFGSELLKECPFAKLEWPYYIASAVVSVALARFSRWMRHKQLEK